MAQINYTATADLKAFSSWCTTNVDQNASTWDSTTQEGILVLNNNVTSIEGWAFHNCTDLLTIDIPEGITQLGGQNTFQNCSNLTTVHLPDSLLRFSNTSPDSIFSGCTSLTTINIPNNITSIDSSFDGCTSLTSIDLNNITQLNGLCFSGCTSLTDVTMNNIVRLENGVGMTGDVGNFYNCSALSSVTLPDTVTYIGSGNFNSCTNLTSVTCLAHTPPTLGQYNFTASNDTLYVQSASKAAYQANSSWNSAFTNIEALHVKIHYTATADLKSFSTWLTNNVDQNASTWDSGTGEGVLVLNSGVTEIGPSAFTGCTTISKINIPVGITTISTNVFLNCINLTSVILPNSLDIIGSQAFYGCTSLSIFTIPNSVTSIGVNVFLNTAWYNAQNDGILYKDNWCLGYKGSKPEGDIVFTNIKGISDYAFQNCTGITSISLPNSLLYLKYSTFQNCTGLTSITLPESLTILGQSTFQGCSNLTTIYWNATNITTYNYNVFNQCSSLTTVIFGDNVTNIPDSVFNGRTSITSVIFGSSITTIPNYAFSGCTGLTSVTFPESLTTMGYSAFQNCTGLTSVTFPESLTSLGQSTFSGCTGLTSVTLPLNVTNWGQMIFQNCTGLTSVTLPEGLSRLGYYMFQGCSNLTTIYWNATNITSYPGYNNVFQNSPINTVIFGDNVTTTQANAFLNCSTLVNITFGNSVTTIGQATFRGCSGLINVNVPENVTIISNESFYGCANLESINLPSSLESIGNNAFYNCTNLLSVICKATTPPTLGSTNFTASNDTLYVYPDYISTYSSNTSWRNAFTNIKGIYTVTTSVSENGSIDPDGSTELLEGQNITINITPDEHYRISSVVYDGLDIGTIDNFTITNIDADHTLEASFEQITYQFSTDCSDGGSIEPYGITEVVEGDSFSFSVTPDEHYRILDVTIDGVSVGVIEGYTFEDVHEGHIIYATFEHITHTITATAFEGGAIIPSGTITVNEGENQSFDIVPLEGYGILAVFIDGTQIEPTPTYTFENIEADHTIDVMFYPLRVAGFNRDEMLDIDYIIQDYLEQLKKRD